MAFEPTPFGKYTLVEKLAVGGMALIYRAKIEGVKGFQKDLVIKQILPQYSDMPDFIDMFIDEAKIAVNLNHANIVPVYELGEIDGALYIAMEYVNGRDIGQVIETCINQHKQVPPNIAAYVLTQVCRALDYAHNKRDDATRKPLKIIHRDVSPNNVIVSFDGDVKIIDFGIAKATIKVSVTQFGTLKGKMIYMSPEQAGERDLDHRSDIFSAGILLYEIATLRQPYAGDNFALLQENVKNAKYPKPSEANPDIPPGLEEIILKAMSKDPGDRFQTAFEMERALSQFLVVQGKQVFDRDVGQFMATLFAAGDHAGQPVPTPISRPPSVPNLSGSGPTPLPEDLGRSGDTRPGVIPPEGGEQTVIRGGANPVPGPPAPGASTTPISSRVGGAIPDDPSVEKTPPSAAGSARIAVMGTDVENTGTPTAEAFEPPPPMPEQTDQQTVIARNPLADPGAVPIEPAVQPTPTSPSPFDDEGSTQRQVVPPPPDDGAIQPPPSWDELQGPPPSIPPSIPPSMQPTAAPPPVPPPGASGAPAMPPPPAQPSGPTSNPFDDDVGTRPSAPLPPIPQVPPGSSAPAPLPSPPPSPPLSPPPQASPPRSNPAASVPPSVGTRAPAPPPSQSSAPSPSGRAPWEEENAEAPPPEKEGKGLGAFFKGLMGGGKKSKKDKDASKKKDGSKKKKKDPEGPPPLMSAYRSPRDFLSHGYQNYSGTRGMFLATDEVDEVPLGVDIPLEIEFADPSATFVIHGQVIWRRAKAGLSKGKPLPAGLAIEFVEDKDDDLLSFYNFLGI